MGRRLFIPLLVLLAVAAGLSAQTVVKTFDLSNDFSTVAGTPRVVRNTFDHNWAVAWRQQGAPSKIMGRIVESDGTLKSGKVLVKKVSSAPQSFDIFPDSVNYTHLLVFETATKDLKTQLFKGTLAKTGIPHVIERGFIGTIPRLAFHADTKQFLLFWLSEERTALKVILLDANGVPEGTARTLRTSAAGSTFRSLNVSTNQDTGNLLVTVLQSNAASGQLLGLDVKPNGTLLKAKPLPITASIPGLSAFSDTSFADTGSGFAFWSDGDKLNRRKVSKKGSLASAVKSLPGLADASSTQTSILFDSRNNLFLGVWTQGKSVQALGLNTVSGEVAKQPFTVATSNATASLDPTTSYDGQVGNAIVVWEDSQGTSAAGAAQSKFRVRGALFFIQSTTSQKGISIGDNFFTSSTGSGNLTIKAGETVTWTDNGNNPHTVTSGSESNPGTIFNSGNLSRGQTFSFRFIEPGAFSYFCRIHGSAAMSGIITVTSDGEPPPPY